jgi:hypothetical protein
MQAASVQICGYPCDRYGWVAPGGSEYFHLFIREDGRALVDIVFSNVELPTDSAIYNLTAYIERRRSGARATFDGAGWCD